MKEKNVPKRLSSPSEPFTVPFDIVLGIIEEKFSVVENLGVVVVDDVKGVHRQRPPRKLCSA